MATMTRSEIISRVKDEIESKLSSLEDAIGSLGSELDDAESAISNLRSNISDAESAVSEAQEALGNLDDIDTDDDLPTLSLTAIDHVIEILNALRKRA